jgi:FkbM family methyltransferase
VFPINISEALFDYLIRPLRVRGKFRFLSPLVPRDGRRIAKISGYRMSLNLGDLVQRTVFLGSYEMNETRWVRSILEPGDTAIDVGANCGYYTALFSRLVGVTGRVLALEPNPSLLAELNRFVRLNAIYNVEVVGAGASSVDDEIILSIPPAEARNESATMAPIPSWLAVKVPIVRLDKICMDRNVKKVKLLKLDIEGHEHLALQGMDELIRSGGVQYLLTELNDYWLRQQGFSSASLLKYLNALGFTEIVKSDSPHPAGITSALLKWRKVL